MLTFLKKFFKPKHPPENSTVPYKIEAPVVANPVKVAVVAPVAETSASTAVNQIAVVAPEKHLQRLHLLRKKLQPNHVLRASPKHQLNIRIKPTVSMLTSKI